MYLFNLHAGEAGQTPDECRAARALAGFTQPQLAEIAGVGQATIRNFEANRSDLMPRTERDIVAALNKAGIVFIEDNGGGAGVRFAKPRPRRPSRGRHKLT